MPVMVMSGWFFWICLRWRSSCSPRSRICCFWSSVGSGKGKGSKQVVILIVRGLISLTQAVLSGMRKVKDERLIRLGSRIREIRKAKGLSQEAFADKCNLDRTYIGSVERGERNISFRNLYIISSNLNLSLSDLLINI